MSHTSSTLLSSTRGSSATQVVRTAAFTRAPRASAHLPCAAARCRSAFLPAAPLRRAGAVVGRAAQKESESAALQSIEGLSTEFCDEFVCTSSPAVEQTVRSMARNLQKLRYPPMNIFQADATYDDGVRRFSGSARFVRPTWALSQLAPGAKGVITRMRMAGDGVAAIEWRIVGSLAGQAVDIGVVTTFEMNVLTGRVSSVKDAFDTARCAPPAAAAVTASRLTWAAKQASQDAAEGLSKVTDSLASMASMDEEPYQNMNPNDPGRFFMPQDNTGDYLQLATAVALLWFVWKAFSEINGISP